MDDGEKQRIYSMLLNVYSSGIEELRLMLSGAVKCNNYFQKIIALGLMVVNICTRRDTDI